MAYAKITFFTPHVHSRLHGETIQFSIFLGWIVTVDLKDDRLILSWVQRSWAHNFVLCLLFKSVDRCCSAFPVWIYECPLLFTELCFDFIKAQVARSIVKTDCSKFERVIEDIELSQVGRWRLINNFFGCNIHFFLVETYSGNFSVKLSFLIIKCRPF